MCGIAGLFAHGDGTIDREELSRMSVRLRPRGPDGEGTWVSECAPVGFIHRRLAIIDLSERGAQPMANADGSLVVTFNGEIYNYRELRSQLIGRGISFRSESDTEVLLALYQEHGEKMVDHLCGMYAFAIWDDRKRGLFAARDPYGIKPLYYSEQDGAFRFASQVRALLAGGAVSRALDPAGVVGFLSFGSVPEPHTFLAAIKALPAGHSIWVGEDGSPLLRHHFSLADAFLRAANQPLRLSDGELQEHISASLRDSVQRHLVGDVPVGAFLSSGIDSGALLGLMRDAQQRDIQTVTLTFAEFAGQTRDEGPIAEQVARLYKTQHCARSVSRSELRGAASGFLDAMDQPSVDGLNTFMVSRFASEAGFKVAISGLGGDELFGGYPSFRDVPRWVRHLRIVSRFPLLGEAFRRGVGALPSGLLPVSPKVAGMLRYGGTYPGAYLLRRGLFMPWEMAQLLPADFAREGLSRFIPDDHVARNLEPDPFVPFARMATLEASLYMRNQLLRDCDWASMAHGLEVRVPLVDVNLLSQVAPALVRRDSVPGKMLLARSPRRPLPRSVLERPKTGFEIPVADLLADSALGLNSWRNVPSLARPRCHWSRRMAYALYKRAEAGNLSG